MSGQVIVSNYDILFEILGNLSIAGPLDPTSRPAYNHWGPQHPSDISRTNKNETGIRRRALFSTALSCKSVSPIALDHLWTAPLGGLYAVLRLLSNLVLEKESRGVHSRFRRGYVTYDVQRYVSHKMR